MKLLYPLAKRFIAGYDFNSARPVIDRLIRDGYQVTIDYVGEMSKAHSDTERAFTEYRHILQTYRQIDVSIKPSQIGLLIDKKYCYENIKELSTIAKWNHNTIRLDMEDSRVTDDTVQLAVRCNVGCAVQANHPNTLTNMHTLLSNNIPIRLVKGAYKEKITHIKDIRDYFLLYASIEGDITIATHDEILLNQLPYHNKLEFLYGIRRDLQEKFKSEGKQVRIYVPYGDNWLPYTIRRLKEWKNFKFVISNVVKELLK